MNLLTSTETSDQAYENIRPVWNIYSEILKQYLLSKNYGYDITSWGFIPICMSKQYYATGWGGEIKRYRKTKKEAEFRLRIDYDKVLKGNDSDIFTLLSESILRGVDIARNEFKFKDFDVDLFRSDLIDLFISKSWINPNKIKANYDDVPGVWATKVKYRSG